MRAFLTVMVAISLASCGGSGTTANAQIDLSGDWSSNQPVNGAFTGSILLHLTESAGAISGSWTAQGTTCSGGAVPNCNASGSIAGTHSGADVSFTFQNGRTTFTGTATEANRMSGTARAVDSGGNPFPPSSITFLR